LRSNCWVGGVLNLLFSPVTAGRGLLKEQDAKTSKSPKRKFFLLIFSPPLIFSFLKRNKIQNAKQIKDL